MERALDKSGVREEHNGSAGRGTPAQICDGRCHSLTCIGCTFCFDLKDKEQRQPVHSQVHPPTGVTLCKNAYFTHVPRQSRDSPKAIPNLILVCSSLLQIYSVR